MGNNQSIEAPKRTSQRLSKPKTGNHATSGLLGSAAPSNTSRRLSNAPLPNLPPQSPTAISIPTASSAVDVSRGVFDPNTSSATPQKESRRRSLFRSMSWRGAADPARPNHNVGPEPPTINRPTRASSMTYESALSYYGPPAPSHAPTQLEHRASWNYNLGSYEAQRLLNLAEEPGLDHETAKSENRLPMVTDATWKSSNPAHIPSAPITRANSDLSLYMPVRRRSIIQTPGVATRSVSMRDLPPLPQPSFRLSHPPTPSLSRQHSVESYRSGIISMPPRIQDLDYAERVVTPRGDEYLSIGAFKLGSLRITNGSPSPLTPEVGRSRDGSEKLRIGGAEDGYFPRAQRREPGDTTSWATQRPVPPPKFLSEVSKNPSELPTPSKSTVPALQTTSKQTALENGLFENEEPPEYSLVEILDVRLDPNAKPPHPQHEENVDKSITRTDSGFVSTASPASEASYKPLSKADSGYSSNVSLRSFQAKSRLAGNEVVSGQIQKQTSQSSSHRSALGSTILENEPPPPPVPPKDFARNSPAGEPKSKLVAKKSVSIQNTPSGNRSNMPGTAKHAPNLIASSPLGDKGPASPEATLCSPGSVRSSTSTNSRLAPSSGAGPQKHGRLQRLLSVNRRLTPGMLPSQPVHTIEQRDLPPVPQEAEHRLRERPARFPTAARRLGLKSRSSLDTLKTIFSVGSMEASLDTLNSMQIVSSVPESESKEGSWKQTLNSVPASLANAAAHVIPRHSITRKPLPIPKESVTETESGGSKGCENGLDAIVPASPVDHDDSLRSPRSKGRAMSLTFMSERRMKLKHRTSAIDLGRSTTGLPSPPLPSPVAKALSAESQTQMSRSPTTTKRPQSLRVPAPLRPQPFAASLSRRSSRESIQSYPDSHTLTSPTTVEGLYSPTSNPPGVANGLLSPSGVSMDPRRLSSFRQYHRPPESLFTSAIWETQTDDGISTIQSFPPPSSRRNSISSVQSEGVYGSHVWHGRTSPQPLRHRASYDGYSHQQRYGHPPSMSNGYTAPTKPGYGPQNAVYLDPAATWSRSQLDAAVGQWYQAPPHHQPPRVPRGHHRHRSLGSRGPNPPYRVLHSYNSPAYRNVPIWG